MQAVKAGLYVRTRGKSNKVAMTAALKCLHRIRNILNMQEPSHVSCLQPRAQVVHEALCGPVGPTADELVLARCVLPGIDYGLLRSKMQRVFKIVHDSKRLRRAVPVVKLPECASCGNTELVYDAQVDDEICTNCGVARKRGPHQEITSLEEFPQPMLSEPLVGHRFAQASADAFSGHQANTVSIHTKWNDYVNNKEFIESVCGKLHLGAYVTTIASHMYKTVRYRVDRLEKPLETLVACVVISKRMCQCK